MSELFDYAKDEMLDHMLGKGLRNWTSPAALYVALLAASPADSATGSTISEVSGGTYVREAVTFAAASSGSAAATNTITWTNTGTAAWTIVGVALVDATAAGNAIIRDVEMVDATINQNGKFKLTSLTVSLD